MWDSELQFADSFEIYLHGRGKALGQQGKGAMVLREYAPGYGRVDVVMVVYDVNRLKERQRRTPSHQKSGDLDIWGAYAMAYLTHTRWVSIKTLSKKLNIGLARARKLISHLEHRGLVETRDDLVKAYSRQANFVIDYIEAFELKLKNWKFALEQACRHLWFASRSYVVMPSKSETVSRRLSLNCSTLKIGAILCESKDSWETICYPPQAIVPTSTVGYLLNEAIVIGAENGRLSTFSSGH